MHFKQLILLILLLPAVATAQIVTYDEYGNAQYGTPLTESADSAGYYQNRGYPETATEVINRYNRQSDPSLEALERQTARMYEDSRAERRHRELINAINQQNQR